MLTVMAIAISSMRTHRMEMRKITEAKMLAHKKAMV